MNMSAHISEKAKSFAWKTMTALLGVPMLLSMPACTDDEVVTTIGAIAIVGGAIAIGAVDDRTCHGGYETRCMSTHDRWGRIHRDCREVYDSCKYYYAKTVSDVAMSTGPKALSLKGGVSHLAKVDSRSADVASKLNIGFDAAEKIVGAIDQARQGDAQGIKALGLDSADLQALGRMNMVSDAAIARMSVNLDITEDSVRDVLNKMIEDIRSQARDLSSPYWQRCMSAGKWRTPENMSCKRTYWSGCSPDTGASMCVPK